MRLHELIDDEQLDEGPVWDVVKKQAAGAAVGAGIIGGVMGLAGKGDQPPPQPAAITQPTQPTQPAAQQSFNPEKEKPLVRSTAWLSDQKIQDQLALTAMGAGIEGEELAAFLAQMAHETLSFISFVEKGSPEYFKRMYDIKGKDPEKARLLGNTKPGDGFKYRGRGYIHLTGKDNYAKAERGTGHPLVANPDLAANPQVAADVAVWFWNTRIRPNVKDWSDTKSVTRRINPALRGLEDRDANFQYYKRKLKV
jgi:putative chitinase